MVGAVIVAADGHIIGEGFTSPVGGPHAEVNAFASVRKADEPLLPGATIYVSLEPCSHWGHTPPCCDLIISKKCEAAASAGVWIPLPRCRDVASSGCGKRA
jgi:diaminohydroxyphosphoribosylaminopyrimidine deaminase/5-amino-6-(5-phosphoribosylamino)uracil reductase